MLVQPASEGKHLLKHMSISMLLLHAIAQTFQFYLLILIHGSSTIYSYITEVKGE